MSLKVQCFVPGDTKGSGFVQVNTNGNFSSNYRIDEVTKILKDGNSLQDMLDSQDRSKPEWEVIGDEEEQNVGTIKVGCI
jgi:hypothetical protein